MNKRIAEALINHLQQENVNAVSQISDGLLDISENSQSLCMASISALNEYLKIALIPLGMQIDYHAIYHTVADVDYQQLNWLI